MFDKHQEDLLILKLYHKEMYKESYIMWMQLWEIEYQKALDYFRIIGEKNDHILRQDAVIEKQERVLASCDHLKNEYYADLMRQIDKNEKLEKWLPAMFVLGAITGAVIRSQTPRR